MCASGDPPKLNTRPSPQTENENPPLKQFPAKFARNRVMGGRDVARFDGLVEIDKVMRRWDLPVS